MRFLNFTKFLQKKLGELTRFSPNFEISLVFRWIYQVLTKPDEFFKFSPGFHQVVTLVICFFKFTAKTDKFHQKNV